MSTQAQVKMCKEKFFGGVKHEFDKWQEVEQYEIEKDFTVTGYVVIQERKCLKCGFIETNKKTVTI